MGMILPHPPEETVPISVVIEPVVIEPDQRIVTIPDTGPESRAKGSEVTLDPPKRTK